MTQHPICKISCGSCGNKKCERRGWVEDWDAIIDHVEDAAERFTEEIMPELLAEACEELKVNFEAAAELTLKIPLETSATSKRFKIPVAPFSGCRGWFPACNRLCNVCNVGIAARS